MIEQKIRELFLCLSNSVIINSFNNSNVWMKDFTSFEIIHKRLYGIIYYVIDLIKLGDKWKYVDRKQVGDYFYLKIILLSKISFNKRHLNIAKKPKML